SASAIRVESRRVFTQFIADAAGFDANHTHSIVGEKRMEEPDGIRSAPNAGNQTNLGTRASGVPVSAKSRRDACVPRELRACFASNHALKFADHQRIWMRTERAAKQVIGIGNIRHPVTQ